MFAGVLDAPLKRLEAASGEMVYKKAVLKNVFKNSSFENTHINFIKKRNIYFAEHLRTTSTSEP